LGFKPAPSNARPSDLTFLFHLRQVCTDPKLGAEKDGLSAAVEALATWLEGEFIATGVNLHAIDVVAEPRPSERENSTAAERSVVRDTFAITPHSNGLFTARAGMGDPQ
jgi:hypothetical protein